MSTLSLIELFDLFSTDEDAEEWFRKTRWPDGLIPIHFTYDTKEMA